MIATSLTQKYQQCHKIKKQEESYCFWHFSSYLFSLKLKLCVVCLHSVESSLSKYASISLLVWIPECLNFFIKIGLNVTIIEYFSRFVHFFSFEDHLSYKGVLHWLIWHHLTDWKWVWFLWRWQSISPSLGHPCKRSSWPWCYFVRVVVMFFNPLTLFFLNWSIFL